MINIKQLFWYHFMCPIKNVPSQGNTTNFFNQMEKGQLLGLPPEKAA